MLMDLLVKQKYKLFYSGDLDPEGIQIADKLKQRYKNQLSLLGFKKEIYYKNLSKVELSDIRLQNADVQLGPVLFLFKFKKYRNLNI